MSLMNGEVWSESSVFRPSFSRRFSRCPLTSFEAFGVLRIFSALFIYYLYKIRSRTDLPRGFVACVAFITAGAIGNVIDCVAYGQLFNDPIAPQVAQFLPSEGGYASLFNGKVVDMLYFPLCEWDWPQWMPGVGGEHFLFFQPIFNVADACLTTSIIVMILFYSKYLAGDKKKEEEASEEGETNKNATEK